MTKSIAELSAAASEDNARPSTADPDLAPGEINEHTRIPFGSMQARLAYDKREGYHRHWFNDSPGRLERALLAGYKHVMDHDGKIVKRVVGTASGGGALHGYLMEIPNEWWKSDLAAIQNQVDAIDKDIREGNVRGKVGEDGRYIPANRGIKVTHGSASRR